MGGNAKKVTVILQILNRFSFEVFCVSSSNRIDQHVTRPQGIHINTKREKCCLINENFAYGRFPDLLIGRITLVTNVCLAAIDIHLLPFAVPGNKLFLEILLV